MNLVSLSIKRPIFITMIAVFLMVVGILALQKLPVDLYPNISYPVLAVRADLKGAAPQEMEQLVTKKIEDALSTVADVKTIRSVSREGSMFVVLEFNQTADIKFQEIQVRAKVGNIRRSLPSTMSEPVVYRQDPDDTPVIEIAVTGNRPASELSDVADKIIGLKLRQIEGVGDVQLSGSQSDEIHVEIKPQDLASWHLNATDIVSAISRSNRNDPVGKTEGSVRRWTVRSLAQANTPHDIENIAIGKSSGGSPLFVRDVASVVHGYSEVDSISRFGDGTQLSPAVIVQVLKQSGENTVAISDRVQAALKELEGEVPTDIKMRVARDNADLIRSNVADVYETLIIAGILTIVVVLLFLRSPRSTLTTGLALPFSVVTTFAVMLLAGFTINVMTLLALSLSIGLLVDDAIVVRENIFRHLHITKLPGKEAALRGTQEVSLAIVATTLTVVAVFLPVAFMGGVTGQFFKPFALTVVFAMLVSLWDALTMAPMLSAYYANIPDPADEWKAFGRVGHWFHGMLIAFEHQFDCLANVYARLLKGILLRGWIALLIAAGAMAIAVWGFGTVKKSFLPTQLGSTFAVSVDGPLAIPLERVAEVGTQIDERLRKVNELEFWTMNSGSDASGTGRVNITAHVKDDFANNQTELASARDAVRKALQGFSGFNVRISEPADPLAGGGGRFQPLVVSVNGEDPAKLLELAKKVRQTMVGLPGASDVGTLQEDGLPEAQFKFNNALAAEYGISSETLANNLSVWVLGDSTNVLRVGDDQWPIRVRLQNGNKLTPTDLLLQNIVIKNPGNPAKDLFVPISNFVTLRSGAGPNVIVRENRQRTLRVGASIAQGAALGTVVADLRERLNDIPLESGYTLKVQGQNQQMDELFSNILAAIALGSIFVYMVLAALFESFLQPIAVMAAIPLAATGAVLALLMFNLPLDLYGGIGMVLLAAIVAKNSILLVDFAMQRVRDLGDDPFVAVLESAPMRLRPILMTSVAMIVGMLPVAMGLGAGGSARRALGIATIGGVISSTILTLIVVPNLYLFIEKIIALGKRSKKKDLAELPVQPVELVKS